MESMKTVAVSQRKGSCCIHQTVITTTLPQKYSTTDDQKLRALVAEASREIDDDADYYSVAAQVVAIEAVVAKVKQIDEAAMPLRIEKLEKELAELKRELERYDRQERTWWTTPTPLVGMVARALLPEGIKTKLRCVRDGLNLILGD